MSTIVTRAGKGSALTWTEGDANITNLNNDKIEDIVEDLTPQLGGNLDVNGNSIVSTSNANINITPNGTGSIVLDGLNWPQADGTANQVLTTNGSGQLSWATGGGGGITLTDDTSTNATRYIIFDDSTSGSQSAFNVSSTKLTFNPSTGTLTATEFSGSFLGNSTTASQLETARSIFGNSWSGSSDLTSIIASTYGGTGNGFTKFTGPTTSEKTFTLPDSSETLLYSGGALGTPSSGNLSNTTVDGTNAVGFKNLPAVGTKTTSYTLTTSDKGKYVQVGSGGSITIPDATFAEGDCIVIANNHSAAITITCTITTAYIAGTDTDKATVSLATRGIANIFFLSGTACIITGSVS